MFFKKKKKEKGSQAVNLKDKLMDIVNSKAFLLFSSCLDKNEDGQDVLNHSLIVSTGFKIDDVALAIDEMTKLSNNFKNQLSRNADREVEGLTKQAQAEVQPADDQSGEFETDLMKADKVEIKVEEEIK